MSKDIVQSISTKEQILELFRSECRLNGTLSHRGFSRLAGVQHTSIIRSGAFNSAKLSEKLIASGIDCAALINQGWSIEATILGLEYFAFDANRKTRQSQHLFRVFGAVGITAIHQEALGTKPVVKPRDEMHPFEIRLQHLNLLKDLIDRIDEPSELILQKFEDRVRDLCEPASNDSAAIVASSKEWTVRDRLEYKEIRYLSRYESAIGRRVAKAYREAFGKEPMKVHRVLNGKQRKCTVYLNDHVFLIDEVIEEYLNKVGE